MGNPSILNIQGKKESSIFHTDWFLQFYLEQEVVSEGGVVPDSDKIYRLY